MAVDVSQGASLPWGELTRSRCKGFHMDHPQGCRSDADPGSSLDRASEKARWGRVLFHLPPTTTGDLAPGFPGTFAEWMLGPGDATPNSTSS